MERLIQYAGNHPWLVTIALVAAALVIAYELRERRHSASAVGPQELIRALNQGAAVLDLRSAEAYAAGHISGSKSFNSADILNAAVSLKKYKEKVVIAVCDSGSLSASAARQLTEQGFTQAYNLRGGIAAWRADNLPLSKGAVSKDKA